MYDYERVGDDDSFGFLCGRAEVRIRVAAETTVTGMKSVISVLASCSRSSVRKERSFVREYMIMGFSP